MIIKSHCAAEPNKTVETVSSSLVSDSGRTARMNIGTYWRLPSQPGGHHRTLIHGFPDLYVWRCSKADSSNVNRAIDQSRTWPSVSFFPMKPASCPGAVGKLRFEKQLMLPALRLRCQRSEMKARWSWGSGVFSLDESQVFPLYVRLMVFGPLRRCVFTFIYHLELPGCSTCGCWNAMS